MGAHRLETVEERDRRLRGAALSWTIYSRIIEAINNGQGVRGITVGRMDYMCLCIAYGNTPGKYQLVEKLFGVPLYMVEDLPDGVVVVA